MRRHLGKKMNLRRITRYPFEVLLTCLGMAVFPFIPRGGIVKLAALFGALAFHVSPRERRIGMANLDVAFGSAMTGEEKTRILKESYRTFFLAMLDLLWFSVWSESRMRRYVKFDAVADARLQSGPLICLTGHMGNWEVLGKAAAMRYPPVVSVAAPLKNGLVDRMVGSMRRSPGHIVVYREGAVRAALAALRDRGRVGLVLDQNVNPGEGGKFVKFFGLSVPFSGIAEKLAARTGAPVFFFFCIPMENGEYVVRYHAGIEPTGAEEDGKITQMVANVFEDAIRQNPGNWLWMYKRWKLVPPGESADRYPYYAVHAMPAGGGA